MRNIAIIILILGICSFANADVYLIINDNTKDILSMSSQDDAQLPADGYSKVVLPGNLNDYVLQANPVYYKYKNDKFVMNIKKISDAENKKQELEETAQEESLVQDEVRKMAIDSLKTKGIILKHIK